MLTDLIKEKKGHRLKHVDASDLILTQVSLPVGDGLEETLKTVELTQLTTLASISSCHICTSSSPAPSNGETMSALLYVQTDSTKYLQMRV
jgi:hypothetical protein